MRPDPSIVLGAIAASVAAQVPQTSTPFGQQTLGIAAMLSAMLAQDIDRAPARLAEEIRATREILRHAQPVVADAELSGRIDAALDRDPLADLHVSALQSEDDLVRDILIDVHARLETLPGPEATALIERLWDELRESTRRRHVTTLI